jgi:hypothetical protein
VVRRLLQRRDVDKRAAEVDDHDVEPAFPLGLVVEDLG